MKVPRIKATGAGALSLLRSAWKGTRYVAKSSVDVQTLNAIDREKLLSVLSLGCPRSTAAKYVKLTGEQLEAVLDRDESLLREVLRAEAEAEVRHMGNIHKASGDEKNWRTSAWWLQQRGWEAPEDDAAEADFPEAVLTALDKFAELIVAEIPDITRRQGLLTKLLHVAAGSVEAPLVIDAVSAEPEPAEQPPAEQPAPDPS